MTRDEAIQTILDPKVLKRIRDDIDHLIEEADASYVPYHLIRQRFVNAASTILLGPDE